MSLSIDNSLSQAESASVPDMTKSTVTKPPGRSSTLADEQLQVSSKHSDADTALPPNSEDLPANEENPSAPPLPDEPAPPLPNESTPGQAADDGWEPVWDANVGAYYFHNRITRATQWENPRIPEAITPSVEPSSSAAAESENAARAPPSPSHRPRYKPAIHGSYDPNADYARYDREEAEAKARQEDIAAAIAAGANPAAAAAAVDGYAATGSFNRFTGRWQRADINPENYNDEAKSNRQQRAFFDVELAANSHDGRSLKAERSGKKLSKDEVKAFKDKRRAKKEEKRRAWLRD